MLSLSTASGPKAFASEELAAEFGVSRVTFRQAVELLQPTASSRRSGATAGAVRQDRWLKVETTLSDLADMYRDTSLEIVNISASRSDAPVFPENGNGRLHASASRHSVRRTAAARRVHREIKKNLVVANVSKAF